jgi:predicted protein tyrosine phosphatase
MIEMHPNLFVGDEHDYVSRVVHEDRWAVVHACKEPYHRQTLGYSGRGAPKDHPEYLAARRGDRLILNMVDANDPAFFAKEMIDQALDFIDEQLAVGHKVLVHCNQGESRAPSIALLYMACRLHVLPTDSLEAAERAFVTKYPGYNPKPGIREHLRQNWQMYCTDKSS